MQDPATYLNNLGLSLPCAVHPEHPATLEPGLCRFVNYEAYYFADAGAMAEFEKEPYRYTGPLTDPVTLRRFQPSASSKHETVDERLFYFSSDESAAKFAANPDQYATLMLGMRPMD